MFKTKKIIIQNEKKITGGVIIFTGDADPEATALLQVTWKLISATSYLGNNRRKDEQP